MPVQKEEEFSFRELYDLFKNKVFNTALGYLQNTEDAEEITQDVFLEVYDKIKNFRGEAAVSTWIYRITVNKCLDFLRYKKRQKRFAFFTHLFHPETGEPLHEAAHFDHPGIALEKKESAAILFKAIDRLPEKQKSAFILSKVEGMGNKEISEVMKMSVGAVESLLSRGKENLRKELKPLLTSPKGRESEN